VDGVGTLVSSDELVYFTSLTAPTGSFASEINVEKRDVWKLPDGADPQQVAVLVNAVMSGWMALTARVGIMPGQKESWSVAVLGATGVSGQAAVQVAKALGAERVVAIGKPGVKLEKTKELGATATIALGNEEKVDFSAAADVNVVLDYLWGDVAQTVLPEVVEKRKDKSQKLSWVEIGALGGDGAEVSGALLRKANLVLLGCGPGSWSFKELGAQMPAMLEGIVEGGIRAEFKVERLEEVERWWSDAEGPRKLVKI
jgi:NADPH:quinone reductase-like Zn-dependent oxidoreductase